MFDADQSSIPLQSLVEGAGFASADIRTVLKACSDLPVVVAFADFSHIYERAIDDGILENLCGDSAYPSSASDWLDRRKRRRKALSPYLNKRLTCVFIRLPGVHYTIEIDPRPDDDTVLPVLVSHDVSLMLL